MSLISRFLCGTWCSAHYTFLFPILHRRFIDIYVDVHVYIFVAIHWIVYVNYRTLVMRAEPAEMPQAKPIDTL
jgi:hypothetical protein